MKVKFRIRKYNKPEDYYNSISYSRFIIEKKSWFGWKRRVSRVGYCSNFQYYQKWTYVCKDFSFTFTSKKNAILYLKTLYKKLDYTFEDASK